MDSTKPILEPYLIDAAGVGQRLGVSKSQIWELHRCGLLGPVPVRLGARTLWADEEILEWTRAGCPTRERWLNMQSTKKKMR